MSTRLHQARAQEEQVGKMTTLKKLTDAIHSKTVVRFVSRYEEGRIEGYMLDVGPKFS